MVTGAGTVGAEIARQLVRRGDRAVIVDLRLDERRLAATGPNHAIERVRADVRDLAALEAAVQAHGAQSVIHTAALLTGACRQDPKAAVDVNIGGALNVMELARRGLVGRVVLCSSTTVTYQSFDDYPGGSTIPEDFTMKALSQAPGSFYAATKLAAEHFAGLYRSELGVDVVCVRYGAVLGLHADDAGLVARMLRELLVPAQQGREAVVSQPAHAWLGIEEFIDVRDCAAGTLAALDAPAPKQLVYTLSSDQGWTLDSLTSLIRELHPDFRVRYDVAPAGGFANFSKVRRAPSDISAAARDLAWRPRHSLKESIAAFDEALRRG
nr:NAD(P)-dependent oxidoreductase [Ramlibacter aurantiacus]